MQQISNGFMQKNLPVRQKIFRYGIELLSLLFIIKKSSFEMKMNKVLSIRFSFFQLFSICCLASQSQNTCLCKEVDQQQFDHLLNENDSVNIQRKIAGLKHSSDKNCQVIAYNLEVDQLFSQRIFAKPGKISAREVCNCRYRYYCSNWEV